MSHNKITVLPCPFCGFDDVEIDEIDAGVHAVSCSDCGTIGPHPDGSRSQLDAINAWNRAPRLLIAPPFVEFDDGGSYVGRFATVVAGQPKDPECRAMEVHHD